jgi:hypothetical protein
LAAENTAETRQKNKLFRRPNFRISVVKRQDKDMKTVEDLETNTTNDVLPVTALTESTTSYFQRLLDK